MMRALWIRDCEPLLIEKNEFPLEVLQNMVGGLIEPFHTDWDKQYTAYCNEEGKINGVCKPQLALVVDGELVDLVYGDVVVIGLNMEGETISLGDAGLSDFSKRFMKGAVGLTEKDTGEELIINAMVLR